MYDLDGSTLAIARLDVNERIPTRGRMPTFGAFWSTRTEPRPEHSFEFDGSARRSRPTDGAGRVPKGTLATLPRPYAT